MPSSQKRATVYFDPGLHRALRLKAVETDRSLSAVVAECVDAVRRDPARISELRERLERGRRLPDD